MPRDPRAAESTANPATLLHAATPWARIDPMLSRRTIRNLLALCALALTVGAQTKSKSISTTGILRQLTPQRWTIEAEDHRILWYEIPNRLPLVSSDGKRIDLQSLNPPIDLGDMFTVRSNQDDEGHLFAQSLTRI